MNLLQFDEFFTQNMVITPLNVVITNKSSNELQKKKSSGSFQITMVKNHKTSHNSENM